MRIRIWIQLFSLIRLQLPKDPDPQPCSNLKFTIRYLHAVFTILMNEVTIERQSRANLSEKTQFKSLN
jgi:hypothetical protein